MQEPRQTKRIPGKYVVYFVIAFAAFCAWFAAWGIRTMRKAPPPPPYMMGPPAPQKPASEAPQ
jgi:hypothetical protein